MNKLTMNSFITIPKKIKEKFQNRGYPSPRKWKDELRFKQDVQDKLMDTIQHVRSVHEWYRSDAIDGYADTVQHCVARLDKGHVYYRNHYDADLVPRDAMEDDLQRRINLREYQVQHHKESILQEMYDEDIYLAQKSLHTIDTMDSDWVIRRVDSDTYNHKNVYYQAVDGAVMVHFCYRLVNAIDAETNVKKYIFDF